MLIKNFHGSQSDTTKTNYRQRISAGLPYGELLGLYRSEEQGGRENVWVKTGSDGLFTQRKTFLMRKDGGKTNKNVV